MKPTLSYVDIVGGKVVVECEYHSLPDTTVSYDYKMEWHSGASMVTSHDLFAANITADASVTMTEVITMDQFKEGVSPMCHCFNILSVSKLYNYHAI